MGTRTSTPIKPTGNQKPDVKHSARRTPQQARGQQRVEAILSAAEAYFVEVGYEAATTNELAARAGVSIGSIYQFFPNKAAILHAITARYREYLAAELDKALVNSQSLSVGDLAGRMIDVAVKTKLERGPFVHMIMSDSGGELSEAGQSFRHSILQRIADLIGERAPQMPEAQRLLHATVSQSAFAAHLIAAKNEAEHGHIARSHEIIAQAKFMQTAYFEKVLAEWLR